MNVKKLLPILAVVALVAACGEEKREGQLTLSGSAPVTVVDESGARVAFGAGPLKVEFGADGSRKFTVKLSQGERQAKFSGRVPDTQDWNFTVAGGSIGQPFDLESRRSVTLTGPTWTGWGQGGSCGFNGTWQTEETWRKGDEDWSVVFKDAGTGRQLGVFASKHTQDYLLSTRNTWCRERPEPHEPHGPHGRWSQMAQDLGNVQPANVKFD